MKKPSNVNYNKTAEKSGEVVSCDMTLSPFKLDKVKESTIAEANNSGSGIDLNSFVKSQMTSLSIKLN